MIVVCSLRAAAEQLVFNGATKAVSILGSESEHPRFETVQACCCFARTYRTRRA
jgi:hypothetical protein